jgi:preprotein translocase subunit SecG
MNKKIRFLIKNICNFLVQIIIVFAYIFFLIAIIFIQLNYAPNKKKNCFVVKIK